MKDIIAKTLTLLIGFGLVTYVGRLISQGAHVTGTGGATNILALAACAAVALYLVALNFYYPLVPNNRWMLALVGIVMVIVAHNVLVDKPQAQIYLRDIMKLVGVFFIIAGPTKLLISKKRAEQLEEEGVEVIEV